jgi:hypothetical protein
VNLDFINKYPAIRSWLMRQVGYYSKTLFKFSEGKLVPEFNSLAKVIIVAKCHYSESWQTFTSVNKKELDQILKLKKESFLNTTTTFQSFKNKAIDGYDVKITTIDESVVSTLGKDKIYLPDSELFSPNVNNQLLQLETPAGKVFCALIGNKIKTSYAKGIIYNVETYKLSVGLSDDVKSIAINSGNFPQFLISQLLKLKLTKLSQAASFDLKSWFSTTQLHLLYWAPLLTAFSFYLVINSYLYFKTNSLEQSLIDGGEQITEIIAQKSRLDNNLAVLSVLSNEFGLQSFVHHHWQIIDQLLAAEMQITRINYKDNQIIIRGLADKASDVLTTITDNEKVNSAAFEGPVRKSRGKDSFILTLQIKES